MDGRMLTVSFAEPKPSEQAATATATKSRAIYVGGLPPGANDEKLRGSLSKYGDVSTHIHAISMMTSF